MLAGLLSAMLSIGLIASFNTPLAHAAATAVLNLAVQPVDYATGAPQTEAQFGTHGDKVAYKVSYSCAVATCDDTTVQLSPSQPDPLGLAAQGPAKTGVAVETTLLVFDSWTKPDALAAATIGGTDATGKLVSLGTLNAGDSGSFTVIYSIPPSGTYTTIRASEFYPDGFAIKMSGTISSPTAAGDVVANADDVTWHNEVPSPSVAISGTGTVAPGQQITYRLWMGSGSMPHRDAQAVAGTSQWVAAASYTVTETLAPEATYVSSSGGGVYDAVTHTVTWTDGTDSPDYLAAGGWGSAQTSGWTTGRGYNPRTVTVSYPASAFPEADATGCNFDQTVSTTLSTTVTYLDPAHTQKSASTSASHSVSCYDPFGRQDFTKDSSASATVSGTRQVYVPDSGQPANQYYWRTDASNGGNVPGVAVITDDALDQADAPVNRIVAATGSTIAYTLNTGVTGTATTTVTAPAGNRFTRATVTTAPIQPVNIRPSDTRWATSSVYFYYTVASTAPVGDRRTNTASAVMTYPDDPEIPALPPMSASQTVQFAATPVPPTAKPTLTAGFTAAAAVEGGGNAVPGRNVTFQVRGATTNLPDPPGYTPEFVFIAPTGWKITPGSASFPAASVPEGVGYHYGTVTIAGAVRDVVVASWPSSATFSANATTPSMSVVAVPTYAVAAGTISTATTWFGDSRLAWSNTTATFASGVQNTADVNGDGNTSEWFSSAGQNVLVGAADGISAVKEICKPNPSSPDGCDWIADPTTIVGVATDATSIEYRITVSNTGNTTLTNVVAYDVLPYIGDTGTSRSTASSPRGSTFDETLAGDVTITDATSPGVTAQLSYSASTNPKRDEVYPAAPGAVDDWNTTAAGKRAIKAAVTSDLDPGQSVQFAYTAAVASGAGADAIACNSVAVSSAQIPVAAEPRAVCASTQEADLAITAADRLPLQEGRPGQLPFVVTNLGGSQNAPASVEVDIPAGLAVTSFAPDGWSCSVASGNDAPAEGPVALACSPVNPDGSVRLLAKGTATPLSIAVTPSETDAICVPADVSGTMNDPDLGNNGARDCFTVLAATPGLALTKDDGLSAVSPGQEYSYTLAASNLLVGEAVTGVVLTDALPDGVEFVSASPTATVTGQAAPDAYGHRAGGVVSWALPKLAATGVAGPDGDGDTGATGTAATVTVTVRALPNATGSIANTATVVAADPADATAQLTATATDTDAVRALSLTKTASAPAIGVVAGDLVTYTVTAKNTSSADYTADAPASVRDDLSAVLTNALFNPDSAMISIGGAAAVALPDPTESVLAWSGALRSGASAVITYSVTVTGGGQEQLVNSAYVTTPSSCTFGVDAGGFPCATATVAFAPVLSLAKTAKLGDTNGNGTADVGEKIAYSFVVTNTGGSPAADVAITDPKVTGLAPAAADIPAGGSATFTSAAYTVTQADVDAGGVVLNTATASGADGSGRPIPDSEPSTAAVPVTASAPGLTIVKSGELQDTNGDGRADAGEKIAYSFVVTNTGNVTANDVTVTDPKVTGLSPASATLAPGMQQVFTAEPYTVTQDELDTGDGFVHNTATASAVTSSDAAFPPTTPSSATVPLADPAPAITIVKTAALDDTNGNGRADAGESITYSFRVTDAGNVTAIDVHVQDPKVTGLPTEGLVLLPGQFVDVDSAPYTVTQADVDAGEDIVNTATVTATDRGGVAFPPSAPSTATVPIAVAAPALSIVKSGDLDDADGDGKASAGESIAYHFVVTNTGNVTIHDIAVDDAKVTGITPVSPSLAPGEQLVLTADDYTVAQADVDNGGTVFNQATVSGTAPSGEALPPSAPSSVTLPLADPEPGLTVVKHARLVDTNGNSTADAGERIRYTFTLTNTGNVTLSGAAVVDAKVTGLTPASLTLVPGEIATVTAADYIVTAKDAVGTSIDNTATATAVAPGGRHITSAPSSTKTAVTAATAVTAVTASDPDRAARPALALTGSNVLPAGIAGGVAVLTGAVLLLTGRLRRRGRRQAG